MRNPQPLTLSAYIWDSPSRSAGRTSIHSLQNLGIQLYITNRFLFSLLTQGCSKNFRILVTGWSHQTKNYSIFSKNLPSAAMHFATRWIHLFYSSAQVDLGLSSTALGNARHASSALSNRVPFGRFSLLEIGKVAERKVWRIRWVRQQLHHAVIEKVNLYCCCVRTCIVITKEKATESRVWAVLVQTPKTFGR